MRTRVPEFHIRAAGHLPDDHGVTLGGVTLGGVTLGAPAASGAARAEPQCG